MQDRFPSLSNQFSLSKFAHILQHYYPKQPVLYEEACEYIISSIFISDVQNCVEQQMSKLSCISISKQQFYGVLNRVLSKKLKNCIRSIESIIKRHYAKHIITKKDNDDLDNNTLPDANSNIKIIHIVANGLTSIQQSTQYVYTLIQNSYKTFGWGCFCKRNECNNKYRLGTMFEQVYDGLSSSLYIARLMKDYQGWEMLTGRQSVKREVEIKLELPMDDGCLQCSLEEKAGKKRKRKKKEEEEEEVQYESLEEFLEKMEIVEGERLKCCVGEDWCKKMHPVNYFAR